MKIHLPKIYFMKPFLSHIVDASIQTNFFFIVSNLVEIVYQVETSTTQKQIDKSTKSTNSDWNRIDDDRNISVVKQNKNHWK